MRRYVAKEQVSAIINSTQRLNPTTETSSNFTYSFNRNISRISEIRIEWVQLPFTFYSINSTNNYFIVNNNTITLTEGNYTSSTIISEINTQIDAVIAGNTTSSYSTTSGKLTIGNDNAITIKANETGVTDSPASDLLGFRSDAGPATSLVGDSALYIAGPFYLHILSSFLTSQVHNKTLYADSSYQNSLTDIKIDSRFGDIIDYSSVSPLILSNPRFTIETTDIIDIQIIDDTGTEIDLNGLDWSMKLIFIIE